MESNPAANCSGSKPGPYQHEALAGGPLRLYSSGGLCACKKATVDFSICNRVSLRDSQ
jgi:hypothetical protein